MNLETRKKLEVLITEVKRLKDLSLLLSAIQAEAFNEGTTLQDKVDISYVLHACANELDEIRKDLNRKSQFIQQMCCILITTQGEGTVYGTFASAKRRGKTYYRIPASRKDGREEEFDKLMQSMGIPAEVYENELVRPHGPGIAEYAAKGGLQNYFEGKELSGTELLLSFSKQCDIFNMPTMRNVEGSSTNT